MTIIIKVLATTLPFDSFQDVLVCVSRAQVSRVCYKEDGVRVIGIDGWHLEL